VRYIATLTGGVEKEVNFRSPKVFRHRIAAQRILTRRVFPKFNAWLCAELRRRGQLRELHGYARCTLNWQPEVELFDRHVDLCTANNYGVQ